jgi:hypothetical protein
LETFDPGKASNNIDTVEQSDIWSGRYIRNVSQKADPIKPWHRLLVNGTHINLLVELGKGWRLIPEKVQHYFKDRPCIVNMSADPFRGHENYVVEELKKYSQDFVVLSGDVMFFEQAQPHVCFFPWWYFNQKYTYDPIGQIDQPRQYKISSMNHVARYHRIENFIKLRRKSYFDQLLFGMRYYYDRKELHRQTSKKTLNPEIVAEFEALLPEHINLGYAGGEQHAIHYPEYYDSYLNYVTETIWHENTMFITEKTWKPFMSGQFGLWLSNPFQVRFLRSIGLDVFDDILQSHHYDLECDLSKRIDAIHTIIDQFMTLDIDHIWTETLSRRQANIDRFYSQDLEDQLVVQCQQYEHLLSQKR